MEPLLESKPISSSGERNGGLIARSSAWVMDMAMCAAMNFIQSRHHLHANSLRELQDYIGRCELLNREQFYEVGEYPAVEVPQAKLPLVWESPIQTPFPENNHARVDLYPCSKGWSAPTVILLHALMSTSDQGYREWARLFNERGWNACFVHLPFHYSRKPAGYFNGELAISANLVWTAEGLRQGVIELRQLMGMLRAQGCGKFGLWASSYGAWIGALLMAVEEGFHFSALMEPIVDVEHAIWVCPAAGVLRRELKRAGIDHALVSRHFHLTSPMECLPLDGGDRVIFASGDYDQIALKEDVEEIHQRWEGSELLHVAQGHFGLKMMPAMFRHLVETGRV